MMDWTRLADWSATALTIIGLGARQQYLKGKAAEAQKNTEARLKAVEDKVAAHDTRLSDGAVAFGRIDEKLGSLKETVENGFSRIEAAVQNQATMLIEHIKDGVK